MKKIITLSLLTGCLYINNAYAACSGEYDKSCGTNCCYKLVDNKAVIQE